MDKIDLYLVDLIHDVVLETDSTFFSLKLHSYVQDLSDYEGGLLIKRIMKFVEEIKADFTIYNGMSIGEVMAVIIEKVPY